MPPSSLPLRFTVNGAAFCATVAIGLTGGVMVGGLFVGPVQLWSAVAVLRGAAAAAAKSVLLLPASVQPLDARKIAFVVDGAGATAVSKQLAVDPKPTRSTILADTGHEPLRAVVLLTSATFAAVADIAIVPVASGVGRTL